MILSITNDDDDADGYDGGGCGFDTFILKEKDIVQTTGNWQAQTIGCNCMYK